MDNVFQHTTAPAAVTTLVIIFFYIQVIFSAMWPVCNFWNCHVDNNLTNVASQFPNTHINNVHNFSNKYLFINQQNNSLLETNSIMSSKSSLRASENNHTDSFFENAFNIIQTVFWFTPKNVTKNYLIVEFIIFLVISLLSYGLIGYTLFRFRKFHRFDIIFLYTTRFIVEIFAPLLFHPAAAFTGTSLKMYLETKESIYLAFSIVGVILYVCYVFLFIVAFSLSSISAYLNVTIYSMFDPTPLTAMSTLSSLFVAFSFLISFFSSWLFNLLQVIHMVCVVIILIFLIDLAFHKLMGTILAISVLDVCIAMDIIMIIFTNIETVKKTIDEAGNIIFEENPPKFAPFIILVGVLVLGIIINMIIFKSKVNRIIRSLKKNDSLMTEAQKNEHFANLKLHLSEKKALMYLRVGFQNNCDLFIDWSLMKFVISHHQSNNAIATCVQLLAFFPGESRQLNAFFISASDKRNLSFSHRFLIYQVYRIKTLRQSSASSDANEKLAELKRLTQNCESEINGFWTKNDLSAGYFEVISTNVQSINSLWKEAIRDYPNNSKYSDEYCRFLIECATDFEQAIVQKQRAELIEMGTNFSVDISFRRMVKNYPNYLKKDILDFKGNFKSAGTSHKKGSTTTSSSSNSNRDTDFSTGKIEVDAELENSLGKLLFRNSKLRMALHHSIKNRSLPPIDIAPFAGIISVVVSFAAFIGLYVYFKTIYSERGTSMDRLNYLSQTRFNFAVTNIILLLDFLRQTGRMDNYMDLDDGMLSEDEDYSVYIDNHIERTKYSEQIMFYNSLSKNNFTTLLDDVTALAEAGTDVYTVAEELFDDSVNITVCYDNIQLEAFPNNMKNLMVLAFVIQTELAGISKKQLFYSDDYCQILANWNSLQTAADSIFLAFSEMQVDRGNELKKFGVYLMIVVPIILFIFTFIPIFSLSLIFLSYVMKYAKALNKMDNEAKEMAKAPLRRDVDEESTDVAEPKNSSSIASLVLFMIFLSSLVLTIICILMVYTGTSSNDTISTYNRWEYYAAQRFTLVAECLHQTLLVVILNSSITTRFTTRARQKRFAINSLNKLREYNENLLQGTDTMDPCFNADDLLDEYNIKDACNNHDGSYSLHNIVKCASANQVISVFSDEVQEILLTPEKFNGSVSDVVTISLVHLCNVHLWKRLDLSLNRIVELGSSEFDRMMNILMIFMIVGLILSLLVLSFCLYIRKRMIMTFSSIKILIKKLPPLQIVNNKALINLLINRDNYKKDDNDSVHSAIIRANLDGIFCIGHSGIVEIVNPAVTTILGYTPEQLLGQPLAVFFNEAAAENILKQIELMMNKQSKNVFEGHTICVTDTGNEVHCHLTILGMTNSHSDVESFVVILRDETELLNNQHEAELAKQKSEDLLYQILPRSIVTRLNQGEKDISFSVPSASISFIDIVKFSEYASLLSPEEIMGNLSTVFAAFDRLLEKYPLVIKIKLIGDVYMSASGLFSPEEPPQNHAEQIIRFALDCLSELEEINVKLNANLSVRIGVNSGGPLIAGVLGTDKPVFDIIGDPINIAARLQSTDVPGRIQIPKSTFDLISNLNFDIEERGEVFLKGKGKTFAYFVKPINIFMAQTSSNDLKGSKEIPNIPSTLTIIQQQTIPLTGSSSNSNNVMNISAAPGSVITTNSGLI